MIETRDLTVTYDGRAVLRAVDLTVPDGGHIALMGPSGCGKTTLLRVLAGLRAPDGGTVRVSPGDSGGRAVSSSASADFFFAPRKTVKSGAFALAPPSGRGTRASGYFASAGAQAASTRALPPDSPAVDASPTYLL